MNDAEILTCVAGAEAGKEDGGGLSGVVKSIVIPEGIWYKMQLQ